MADGHDLSLKKSIRYNSHEEQVPEEEPDAGIRADEVVKVRDADGARKNSPCHR